MASAVASYEDKPLSNEPSTILGVTITFLIVAFLAVVFRLYIRLKLMKSAWWDDAFVTLAFLSDLAGTVFICLSTKWGLGEPIATLSPTTITKYLFHFYAANGTYNLSTALIKLSLLFQYLRVFTSGPLHKLTLAIMAVIATWGLVYTFMAFVPCFPIRAYWDWTVEGAKCYAYGSKTREPFVRNFESHSALNMVFDIVVFLTPIQMVWRKERARREYVAIGGLFFLGLLVIAISSWRLVTIVEHQAGWKPTLDFTWYAPISIVLACLEIDIAILAASMPVFWPVILRAFEPIFVTQEISVTRERIEDMPGSESGPGGSEVESASVHSMAELNRKTSSRQDEEQFKNNYVESVVPMTDYPVHRNAVTTKDRDEGRKGWRSVRFA